MNGTPYHDATPSSTYCPGIGGWCSIAGGGPDGFGFAGVAPDVDAVAKGCGVVECDGVRETVL